ncbi:MAG TPA: phage tail tape measure protein [Hyphomicrobiaceae bacterium]|nr:phage tail tape measure protein [Hyphomicrobiaceae bacterium]
MPEPVETWTVAVTADTSALQEELSKAASYGRQFGRILTTAFEGIALKGKSVGDVLRSLALSLSRMALQAAFRPLEQGIASLFSGIFGGFRFSNGGIVKGGLPVPFAEGGVIASPIAFPMAGGRIGVAGERGAEAILPLARGPDGRLGVRAGGAGINVTFNVTTPDAASFRRSETQIAALLARAVAQGQRNL